MTKLSSHISRIRRAAMGTLLLAGSLSSAACGPHIATCPSGRTTVDGMCVSNQVADYVSCVRSQGAQVDQAAGDRISAEIGYLGTRVGGAYELSETLKKKYSTTDKAALAIVQACGAHIGQSSEAPPRPAPRGMVGKWAGTATENGQSVPVRLAVKSTSPGQCAVLAYPSLGCASVLHCAPSPDGRTIQGVEQIVKGSRCENGGRITLSQGADGNLAFSWKGRRTAAATGRLVPDMMPR